MFLGTLITAYASSFLLTVITGGNAGLAAAYSARMLSIPATILVPTTTPAFTIQRVKDEGATVCVVGEVSLP